MTITARFSSVCPRCGQRIQVGEQARWEPGWRAEHLVCPPPVIMEVSPSSVTTEVAELDPFDYPISDGVFTVVLASGERRTIRIRTQPDDAEFAPGQRLMSYLRGPDNDEEGGDWKSFAFFASGRVRIWTRFREDGVLAEAASVLENRKAAEAAGLAYALESNHCWRCNRMLTVPASIHRGLGPVCAGLIA